MSTPSALNSSGWAWRRTVLPGLAALLCLAAVINVLWFTRVAAIPLPVSDAWYFLDVFVAPALDGSLRPADFFIQRSSDDHAQPIQKLILWLHLHYAQLDFGVEALIGVLLAVVTTALLASLLLRDSGEAARPAPYRLIGVCVLFAVALSLNSTNLYTWSLVTLGWLVVLVAVLYWLGAGAIGTGRRMVLYGLVASFAMAMVVDELAFPMLVAAVIAVAIRDGLRRPHCAIGLALGGALGVAMARPILSALSPLATTSAHAGGGLEGLLAIAAAPGAWHLLVGPLSDSLVHRIHLQDLSPAAASAVQWGLALFLLLAHLAFWWRALVSRHLPSGQTTVVAVALMLLFYATIAGIVLSRVAIFGPEYVHQPRYVMMYQLNIVALALMFFAPQEGLADVRSAPSRSKLGPVAGALLVTALQIPLAISAWDSTRHLRPYVQRSESALRQLGVDASTIPAGGCTDILTVCDSPVAAREKLTMLLRENELNLYSPAFRTRHGFEPIPSDSTAQAIHDEHSVLACAHVAAAWGPMSITPGKAFNVQPNGRWAHWVKLDPRFKGEIELETSGQPVPFDRQGDVISFLHDPEWVEGLEAGKLLVFTIRCTLGGVGGFQVEILSPSQGA